jgi:hypothetical protein
MLKFLLDEKRALKNRPPYFEFTSYIFHCECVKYCVGISIMSQTQKAPLSHVSAWGHRREITCLSQLLSFCFLRSFLPVLTFFHQFSFKWSIIPLVFLYPFLTQVRSYKPVSSRYLLLYQFPCLPFSASSVLVPWHSLGAWCSVVISGWKVTLANIDTRLRSLQVIVLWMGGKHVPKAMRFMTL